MHELLLLRHAEAEPAALDGNDFQRPLTAGGRDAALAAAARLIALPWQPQRLLYSPAVRTAATAALLAQAFRLDPHVLQAVPELYLATPPALHAALTAAARLAALPWQPQRLLYSPALRTATTATLLAQVLRLDSHVLQQVPELYLATPQALRAALRAWRGNAARVMIVGHNPGLSEWGGQLDISHADESLPTAGFWLIEFSGRQWQQLLSA